MKVLLVDDHILVRDGISLVLEQLEPGTVVLTASTCAQTQAMMDKHSDIDLVLLDIGLPDINGIDCLKKIRQKDSLLPVVMLSGINKIENIQLSLKAGARGFIPKSVSKEIMLNAIQQVMSGNIYLPNDNLITPDDLSTSDTSLTPRQRQVLQLLAGGLSNKAIANELGMAEATVRIHVTSIFWALNVTNRTEAAIKAREMLL